MIGGVYFRVGFKLVAYFSPGFFLVHEYTLLASFPNTFSTLTRTNSRSTYGILGIVNLIRKELLLFVGGLHASNA